MRVFAPPVVADARDPASTQDDDLEEPRHESLRAEPLESLAAQLHEHAVAELDHLARPQPVRLGAPEQRAHDLVRIRARLPRALVRRIPGDVVVQPRAQVLVVGPPREHVDRLDGLPPRGHQPTSGSDLTIEPASRRASIDSAIATIVCATADSGCAATIGSPASPCSRSSGSSGTSPRSGTPSSSASASPPPEPNTSPVMFSTTPRMRRFVERAILPAREATSWASFCGVVTTTTSARGRSCASEIETSPVPGGMSTTSTSRSPQCTSERN